MSSTQTLPEAPRTPTLSEVIRAAIDSRLRDVHVALPGRIESYDASEQKADVKPMVGELLPTRAGREIEESLPVIPNVPLVFPRGGGFYLTLPMRPGDFVLLVVNERSIDTWISGDGDEKSPDDFRTHNLSDAVALAGLYPLRAALDEVSVGDNLVIGREGGSSIHLRPDDEIHLGGDDASDYVALAELVRTEVQKAIDYTTAVKGVFNTLTVGASDGGAANAGAKKSAAELVVTPTIEAPASSKVKAD